MTQPVTSNQMMPNQYGLPYGYMQPQNNAVKIDIINPQAGMAQPANYYPTYAMPQVSAFDASSTPYAPAYYPPAPVQTQVAPAPLVEPMVAQPPSVAPTVATAPAPQVVAVPAPVVTTQAQIVNAPQSVIPPMPPAPTQPVEVPVAPVVSEVKAEAPATEIKPEAAPAAPAAPAAQPAPAAPAAPAVEPAKQPEPSVDLSGILTKLNSADLAVQAHTIESVAETAQTNPKEAVKLLDTQLMDSLANIIKKDSTKLAGPTPEQIALRHKLLAGEKLTEEQTKTASTISEMEMVERNKQYAIYTAAILQKLLAGEFEKVQGAKLDMKDYPLINDIVKVAKDDANPMLRASALAALSYVSTKENKDLLKVMFEQSQKDADPNVKAVATEALAKLAQV